MEKSKKVERSEVWNNIYEVLARLDLKQVEGDSLDRPSAATQIEDAVKKLLPIHNVSHQREQLIAFSMDRNKAPKEFRPQYEKEVDDWLKSN